MGYFDDLNADFGRISTLRSRTVTPEAPKEKPGLLRRAGAAVNDLVIEAGNAVASGAGSIGDLVAPGNRFSEGVRDFVLMGEQKQSDATKQAKQQLSEEVAAAEGIGGELDAVGKYVVQNPGLAIAQAAGSFALPGGAIKGAQTVARAAGAGATGIAAAGTAAGVGTGAVLAGGDAAGTAYALVKEAGGTEEQAVQAAREAAVVPAVVGGVGGAFGAERLVAGVGSTAGGATARAVKHGVSEAAQEAVEEGVTAYSGRAAAQPYDETLDPTKGVAAAAGMGAALGGVTGASIGALTPPKPAGPLARAVHAGGDEAVVSAQSAARYDEAGGADKSAAPTPFAQRAQELKSQLSQGGLDQVRSTLGDEAASDVLHYVNAAAAPGLLPITAERFVGLADAILSRSIAQPIPPAPQLEQAPAPPALEAPPVLPAIALDTTPTGTIRVDGAGNAAPEIRADVISTQARVAEADSLGRGPRAPAAEQAPAQLEYDTTPTGRLIAGAEGVRQETRAEAVNRAQQTTEKAHLGLSPDIERAAAAHEVRNSLGAPFTNRGAALRRQRQHPDHEVAQVDGGYVLRARGQVVDAPLALAPAAANAAEHEAAPPPLAEQPRSPLAAEIRNSRGAPFTNRGAALRRQREHPEHEVVPVDGGFVLRPKKDAPPVVEPDAVANEEPSDEDRKLDLLASMSDEALGRMAEAAGGTNYGRGHTPRTKHMLQLRELKLAKVQQLVEEDLAASAKLSRSAIKSVQANLLRGRRAMNKAIIEKADQHRAMHRSGLGWVDFVWGDSKKGLQHIIEQRVSKDGMTAAQAKRLLTQDIVRAIASGTETRRREVKGAVNLWIERDGKRAVLVRQPGSNGWLLTGFELVPGERGGVFDPVSTTHPTPTVTRREEGAGTGASVAPAGEEGAPEGQSGEPAEPDSDQPFTGAAPSTGTSEATGQGQLGDQPAAAGAARSVGLDFEQAKKLAESFERAGLKKVNVARTAADLPKGDRKELEGAEGVRGVYYPSSDQVWVVADAVHSPEELTFVVVHEAFHRGIRGLFGEDGRRIMFEMWRGNASLRKRTATIQAELGVDRATAIEEALADLAGEGQLKNLSGWPKLLTHIRAWLRRVVRALKLQPLKLTDEQIESFVAGVAGAGLKRGAAATGEGGVKMSRAATAPHQKMPAGLNAAQRKALGKITTFAPDETLQQRADRYAERWKEKLVQGVFDQFAPLKGLDMRAYMQARLSKGTDGAVEAVFRFGLPKITDGALDVEADGKGLKGVLADLGGEHDLFMAWVAGNRAEKLAGEGRERLFSADDIKALKALNQGTMKDGRQRDAVYRKASADFTRYQNAVLDVAEKAGLIDAEARALWQGEFYVPFYRVMEDDATAGPGQIGGLTGQRAFKKLKGGTEPLGDLLSNTLSNWSHLLSASMKNMAAEAALQAAEKMGVATAVPEAVKGSVRVMRAGAEKHYTVQDPLVLDALTMLHHQGWNNPAMKAMRWFKHALTFTVTVSPTFRVRNLIRDLASSIATNDLPYNPMANLTNGWAATKSGSRIYQQLIAGGGAVRFGSLNDGEQAAYAKKLIEAGIKDADVLDTQEKVKAKLAAAWQWYQETGDRAETVNRAALYQKLTDEGKDHLEASFAARDLMDFTSAGKWAAVRFLTQIVPFLNARLQGGWKLARAAKGDPRRFAAVAGAIGLASALLHLINEDDEDYKKLPDWARNNYWWVKLGDHAVLIPKPFELGALGTVVERATELATAGDDYQAKDFAKTLASVLGDQLAMNPVPQAFKPAMEAAFNRDTFRDRPIDSMSQERLPAGDRHTVGTSAGAVALGQAFNLSPQRIEHMVKGYFGWVGAQALNVADIAFRGAMDLPEKPARTVAEWFVVGDFVKPADAMAGKHMTRFYEEQKRIEQVYAALSEARKVGDLERATELAASDEMKLRPIYHAADRQMTRLNQQVKAVSNDRTMPAELKQERLKALNEQRNRLAEVADKRGRARQRELEAQP